ncbi:MAG: molybdenum cofactor biosynthesis protein MoaE [Acidobacteria bacterium]|nr:MAG: molybdenum cofactor biosynthesis protein MoaE [Acidobacteriota bacterium]
MIALTDQPIEPRRAELVRSAASEGAGAIVTFEGIVRGESRGKRVTHLFYEAFPEMALPEMERIAAETRKRWLLQALVLVHRTGKVEAGETSVLIAVASDHRAEAFDACRFIIDSVKTTVPIWKREHYEDGAVWIEAHA